MAVIFYRKIQSKCLPLYILTSIYSGRCTLLFNYYPKHKFNFLSNQFIVHCNHNILTYINILYILYIYIICLNIKL